MGECRNGMQTNCVNRFFNFFYQTKISPNFRQVIKGTSARMKEVIILSFMLTLVTSDEPPVCYDSGSPHGGCGLDECVYVKDKGTRVKKCWWMNVCTQATLDTGLCTTCCNAIDQTLCTPTGTSVRCLLEDGPKMLGPTICVTCNRTCESGQVCTFDGGMQKCKYPTTSTATTATKPTGWQSFLDKWIRCEGQAG